MPRTYQEIAAEKLQGFGWSIEADSMVDWATSVRVVNHIHDWWFPLDQTTKNIIGELDLATGIWNEGMLNDWPGLYSLMAGNRFGDFANTMMDIAAALDRAHYEAEDQGAGLAGGTGIDDVVNAGSEAEQQ